MKQISKFQMMAIMAAGMLSFIIAGCCSDEFYSSDYVHETSNSNCYNLLGRNDYRERITIDINKSKLTDDDVHNVKIAENRILENIKITEDGLITFNGLTPSELNISDDIFYLYTNLLEGEPASIIQNSKSKQINRLKSSNPETGLGGVGQGGLWYTIIMNRLDSQIERDHFTHWWEGTGSTLNLSDATWSGIKTVAENLRNTDTYIGTTIINGTTYQIQRIDFYNDATYDFALGVSTMYFIGPIAFGLSDYYDFDSKPWGERGILTELEIRFVAQLGESYGAEDYNICYGAH